MKRWHAHYDITIPITLLPLRVAWVRITLLLSSAHTLSHEFLSILHKKAHLLHSLDPPRPRVNRNSHTLILIASASARGIGGTRGIGRLLGPIIDLQRKGQLGNM